MSNIDQPFSFFLTIFAMFFFCSVFWSISPGSQYVPAMSTQPSEAPGETIRADSLLSLWESRDDTGYLDHRPLD